jgi:hypothetical protein
MGTGTWVVGAGVMIFGLVTVGCGGSSGFLRDATTANAHQYRQEVVAVRYVKSVEASDTVTSVFCIIPTSSEGMYATTMKELHAEAQLKPNQLLENIREDHSFAFYFFFCTSTLTLSADVTELYPPGTPLPSASVSQPRTTMPTPPESEGTTACDVAYAQLVRLMDPLRRIYPNASLQQPFPLKTRFIPMCMLQSPEVQQCLQARFLKENVEECSKRFGELDPRDRRQLFNTFLSNFE